MPQDGESPKQPVLLWWGRSDVAYSRNAIIRQSFRALGWQIRDYRPLLSRFGDLQATLPLTSTDLQQVDLVWVPCFRQRDIAAARRYCSTTRTPLFVDPLISAYDKQVDERAKLASTSRAARSLRRWESALFASADRLVADTEEHAEYFARTLSVDPARIAVIPVGADESMFRPTPQPLIEGPLQILFYGSFLALQGPQTIIQAALRLQAHDVQFTMLGTGPLHAQCVSDAGSSPRVRFEPWIDYELLPARISAAHLLLGVFGTTPKAGRVIPNKVYQALASARAVVTRDSAAYPERLRRDARDGLRFVEAGRPEALAAMIAAFAADPKNMAAAGRSAHCIYQQFFSNACVRDALSDLLASMGFPAYKAH